MVGRPGTTIPITPSTTQVPASPSQSARAIRLGDSMWAGRSDKWRLAEHWQGNRLR